MKRRPLTGIAVAVMAQRSFVLEILISKHKWLRNAFPFVCFRRVVLISPEVPSSGREKKVENTRKQIYSVGAV